jgi:hypothetical protein
MRQSKKSQKQTKKKDLPSFSIPRNQLIQRYLLSYLLNHAIPQESSRDIFNLIQVIDFTMPSYGHIFKQIVNYSKQTSGSFNYPTFVKSIPSELRTVSDELFMFAADMPEFDPEELIRIAYEIKINSIKNQIDSAIKHNTPESDVKISALSEELKGLQKRRRI